MAITNKNYSVTGRYMDGQKLIGYHLVGDDGEQLRVNRDRVIFLISKGMVRNMRIQVDKDNNIIIRGKGINLNKLPVFDEGKNQFRCNSISQEAANTKVHNKSVKGIEPSSMGQYKIIKRIMYKNKCLGYELKDFSGRVTRKKRDNVIELAIQRLISNAVAQKYTKEGETVPQLILRGVDCDLGKLPILIVNEQGKIVDPNSSKSELTVRGAYMKRSGVVRNNMTDEVTTFKAGDFILCCADGYIKIEERINVEKEFTTDTEVSSAICDDYLGKTKNYSVEIFGSKPIPLTTEMIKSWVILRPRAAAV